jgi:hypothetical protein
MQILEIAAGLPFQLALGIVALAAVVILTILVRRGVIPVAAIEKLAALPLIAPILAFLRSERFVAGLASATAIAVVMYLPQLEPFQEPLAGSIAVVYAMVFLGHTYEKAKGGEFGTEDPATPVLGPLDELLRSRKFMALVADILIGVVIALNPNWAPYQAQLIMMVTAFFSAMVGVIALEDGAAKSSSGQVTGTLEELAPFPDEPASGGMMRELAGASDRDRGTAAALQQARTLPEAQGGPVGKKAAPYLAGGPLADQRSDPDWLRAPRDGPTGQTIQGDQETRYVDLDPTGDLPEISRPPAGR